jgi:UDP-GlcNAc3NAcA epimerase
MKILTVVGARPQFIKAAVVSKALQARPGLAEIMLHTGQHFDANMSDIFFDELELPAPKYHLGIGGGTHAENTGRSMQGIEQAIFTEKPDAVLVYGDTDSTLAGALAAAKVNVPVAHVEAGLRSFNRAMPEELNRVVTDHLASWLFTPSAVAVKNLRYEGIDSRRVHQVGDVMHDAVRLFGVISDRKVSILPKLGLSPGAYVLATVHRKENTDDPRNLRAVMAGLAAAGQTVVLPLHPRTRRRLEEFGIPLSPAIQVIDPVGYLEMLQLSRHARLIVTDSGGLQKEAYFHGVPCLVLRVETEWTELVEIGATRLVGTDAERITRAICEPAGKMRVESVYGAGDSAERIAAVLAGTPA